MEKRKIVAAIKPLVVALIIISLIVGVAIGYFIPRPAEGAVVGLKGEIPVGICLTLTGDFASYGARARAAVEIAEAEINDFVTKAGIPVTFKFYYEDTEHKPDVALSKVQSLAARGIKVIVGGMPSTDVKAIAGYVDSNKIVVIDGTSVAPRAVVAPPADYIFRTLPTCEYEAEALVAAFLDKGYKYVASLVTKDAYSLAIQDTFEERFKAVGGTILARIEYAPGTVEFSAELEALEAAITPAVKEHAGEVVILANVWEEVTLILSQAEKRNSLTLDLPWYSTDCLALSTVVIKDAGVLAAKVGLPSVLFDAPYSDRYAELIEKAKAKIGEELDIYALATYDSTWIAALSILAAGKYDGETIKAVVPYISANYFGATGNPVLRPDGDREAMNLALWAVVEENGTYKWEKIAFYDSMAKVIQWLS
ncbi:MAG: ABC transporter substrate-binding protein [Candidatus Bathyarchaeia archaeon]